MKLVLRACAAPLRPAHLAYFLKDSTGSGMTLAEAPQMDAGYHEVAMEAMRIGLADDADFTSAIRNMVVPATKKPLTKMTARNQFLAIAPTLEFAATLAGTDGEALRGDGIQVALVKGHEKGVRAETMEEVLAHLMPRPFVMGLDLFGRLEDARIAGGEAITRSKLQGFVEQHLGAACVFGYDR